MILAYGNPLSWVAAVSLAAAFILTFWKGRTFYHSAAALYSLGTLISVGFSVYVWVFSIWMNYHLSDATSINSSGLIIAMLLPIGMLIYGLAAVALLWPGIPQSPALRFGKILHLIILPLFVSLIFAGAFVQFRGQVFAEMKWLVYGPLWFRIRERLNHSGSRNLQPAN